MDILSGVTCLPTIAHQLDGEVNANVVVVAAAQHAQVILLPVRPRGPANNEGSHNGQVVLW